MNHLFPILTALAYLVSFGLYIRFGAFVLPFILVFFLAAHLAPADRLSPPAAHGVVFAFHVTLSILAYAAFALSFVLSLIFLGEERLLRSHKLGEVVWRLPPLELLDQMSRSSVLVGLISIAIGTTLGFVSVDRLPGQNSFYDPKYVCDSGVEFYGRKSISLAQPPVLLGAIEPRHGNRSRRTESPHGACRGAGEGVIHDRASPACG